jgi:hypothetical protein
MRSKHLLFNDDFSVDVVFDGALREEDDLGGVKISMAKARWKPGQAKCA